MAPFLRRALIVAPMSSELRPVVRYSGARRTRVGNLTAYRAQVGETEVVVAPLGVGPARARRATEQLLAQFAAEHVLVSGIAGGLHPEMTIGTALVPEEVLDLGSGRRYRATALPGTEPRGLVACAGELVTDEARLAALLSEGVVAMEMESSGVAAACETAGVPWTTFRVVSDRPDDGLTDAAVMGLLRPDGTADAWAALRLVATQPRRLPELARLARDSSMAAAKAARAALGALGWVPLHPRR